jgi:S-adenosylmethionine:diacylglycerol 3-amino-3-carboxypropyl transferase
MPRDLRRIDPLQKQQREQARQNLKRAVVVRDRLKDLRRALRHEQIDYYELILGNVPEWHETAQRIKLASLITNIKGIGKGTVYTILANHGANPEERLEDLTYKEREELAAIVRTVRQMHGYDRQP